MTLTASHTDGVALQVLAFLFLGAGIIYSFGYLRAVMHRANKDYKTTKAAVPVLRKGFWAAWWKAVKVGAGVLLAVVVLLVWAFHDARRGDQATTPAPPASTSHR